jgi:hypothetical protein
MYTRKRKSIWSSCCTMMLLEIISLVLWLHDLIDWQWMWWWRGY